MMLFMVDSPPWSLLQLLRLGRIHEGSIYSRLLPQGKEPAKLFPVFHRNPPFCFGKLDYAYYDKTASRTFIVWEGKLDLA